MNRKKAVIIIFVLVAFVLAVVGFYVYADKALDYKKTMPEHKVEYNWARRYGFKAKILSVEYDEASDTAIAEVKILKNYNYYLGDYPTNKVFLTSAYAKYLSAESAFDEYLMFVKRFVNDDGTYDLLTLIGVDGDKISIVNKEENSDWIVVWDKGEFFTSLKEFEGFYYKAVEGRIDLDDWYEEHEKDIEREAALVNIKYRLKFVLMILGGVGFVWLLCLLFLKIINREKRGKKK